MARAKKGSRKEHVEEPEDDVDEGDEGDEDELAARDFTMARLAAASSMLRSALEAVDETIGHLNCRPGA